MNGSMQLIKLPSSERCKLDQASRFLIEEEVAI
jgi:hypothetical protein